jgi:hypothetical protein
MTSPVKLAAIVAVVGLSISVAGCSSSSGTTTSSAPASSASVAPSDSAAGSAPASAAAPSSLPALTVPDDVLTAFLQASCVAPASSGGGAGTWDDTALACTTPDGAVTKIDSAKSALTNPGTRAMFVYTTYTKKIATTLPGCPTLAELEAARNGTAPTTTDECIASALNAVTTFLTKK